MTANKRTMENRSLLPKPLYILIKPRAKVIRTRMFLFFIAKNDVNAVNASTNIIEFNS